MKEGRDDKEEEVVEAMKGRRNEMKCKNLFEGLNGCKEFKIELGMDIPFFFFSFCDDVVV